MDLKLLRIYLQDHLAGASAAIPLAERARKNNAGEPLAAVLAEILAEVREDSRFLEELLHKLDAAPSRGKQAAGWLAEKAGRLKLSGRIVSYSPLSRLEELELLTLGVQGKLALLEVLERVLPYLPRCESVNIAHMKERAVRQRNRLNEQRLLAAERAFLAPAGARGG